MNGGEERNRTAVHGFAGRCITTLPPRRFYTREIKNITPISQSPRRVIGAGNEARTRDPNLGKVVLYH